MCSCRVIARQAVLAATRAAFEPWRALPRGAAFSDALHEVGHACGSGRSLPRRALVRLFFRKADVELLVGCFKGSHSRGGRREAVATLRFPPTPSGPGPRRANPESRQAAPSESEMTF